MKDHLNDKLIKQEDEIGNATQINSLNRKSFEHNKQDKFGSNWAIIQ